MKGKVSKKFTLTQRKHAVLSALGSVREEGFEPSDDAKILMDEYIEGKITVDELLAKTNDKYAKKT